MFNLQFKFDMDSLPMESIEEIIAISSSYGTISLGCNVCNILYFQ